MYVCLLRVTCHAIFDQCTVGIRIRDTYNIILCRIIARFSFRVKKFKIYSNVPHIAFVYVQHFKKLCFDWKYYTRIFSLRVDLFHLYNIAGELTSWQILNSYSEKKTINISLTVFNEIYFSTSNIICIYILY